MKKHMKKLLRLKVFVLVIFLMAVLFAVKSIVFSKVNINVSSNNISIESYENDIVEKTKNNVEKAVTEKIQVEVIDIEYRTYYRSNNNMLKGTSNILQEGKDGKKEIVSKLKYENDTQVSKQIISARILEKSQNQIIEIGTSDNINITNKNIQMIVKTENLAVRQEAGISSTKIAALKKGDKVQVISQLNIWSKIKKGNIKGWVLTDDLAIVNEYNSNNAGKINASFNNKNGLSKNMNIYRPSGFTYEQFVKALSGNSKDKNKVIETNAQFFYYAEKQYKINGMFLAAVAIHESNWGTSKISLDKKNLFGYGASDASPYENAKEFSSYSEGIDLLARVFVKYYLTPSGSYYNGTTLEAINTRYATDKQWANKVYSHMQYLYNRV